MNYDSIIEKYWNGESSLEEEQQLSAYLLSGQVAEEHTELIPLFQLFKEQSKVKLELDLDLDLSDEIQIEKPVQKSRIIKLLPRVAAVAASLALLLMFTTGQFDQTDNRSYVNAETISEQEAYEITKNALAFLGANYEKASGPMKHMKELEHTKIFNF